MKKRRSEVYGNVNEMLRHNEQVTGRNMNGVMNKWKRNMSAISEAFNGEVDDYKLLSTAILLENTSQYLEGVARQRGLNEATQPSDVSFFKRYAINLLSAVVPNLIAEDIVSVQPMLSRVGEIRYLRVLYGSDKAPVKKGNVMFQNYTGGDFSQYTYTSDQIEGESVAGDGSTTKFSLDWTPIIPGSIQGTSQTDTVTDDGNGNIMINGSKAGTVDYEHGLLTFNEAPANEIDLNYTYNNMEVPTEAPEIVLKLVTAPIQAKSRKLKTLYSFDAAYDLTNDYGMSMNNELVTYSASQIKHEIDMEIINDLYTKATSPSVSFNRSAPAGVSLVDHYNGFPIILSEAGNAMYFNTKMARPNFYVLGEDASNIVESLARFKSAGAIDPKGPYLAGYIGDIPVYKSPSIPTDGFLCGYKGSSLFDAGYIYAPYMPIMTTQLLMTEDFTGRQGFASSYGKRMTNTDFYAACKITNVPNVVSTKEVV